MKCFTALLVLASASVGIQASLPDMPMKVVLSDVDCSTTLDVDAVCDTANLPDRPSTQLSAYVANPASTTCAQREGFTNVAVCVNPDASIRSILATISNFVENFSSGGWMVACGTCDNNVWTPDGF